MRAFIGLSLPDALSLELLGIRDRALLQMASAKPRAVIAANFHMTLVFLGEISAQRCDSLAAAIDQLLIEHSYDIQLQLDRARCFPSAGGRIFAAEAKPVAALSWLHKDLLQISGNADAESFRPHITLARLARAFVPGLDIPLGLPFSATELCLYESHMSDWGVRYKVLRRWPLAD
jgi:2'-5' RNA ligase